MLPEALDALAAAGGTAVVQAAGTDFWVAFRDQIARIFSRDGRHDAMKVMMRLDESATALAQAAETGVGQVRARVEVSWQTRLQDLFESLDDSGRQEIANQLRELVNMAKQQAVGGPVVGSGIALGSNAEIHATGGSVVSGVIHGDVKLKNPS